MDEENLVELMRSMIRKEIRDEIQPVREETKHLREDIRAVAYETKQLREENKLLRQDIRAVADGTKELRKENKLMRKDISTVVDETKQLREENKVMREDISTVVNETKHLRKANQLMRGDIHSIREETKQMRMDISMVGEGITRVETAILELKETVENNTTELRRHIRHTEDIQKRQQRVIEMLSSRSVHQEADMRVLQEEVEGIQQQLSNK